MYASYIPSSNKVFWELHILEVSDAYHLTGL